MTVEDRDVTRTAAGDATATSAALPDGYAEAAQQARRAVLPAVVLGVVALIISAVVGKPLVGVGLCIGLAFGMVNARRLLTSVRHRFEAISNGGAKPRFLAGGAGRLAVLTLVTLGAVVLVQPLGFGMLIGLALFQIVMLSMAAAVMYRQVRP